LDTELGQLRGQPDRRLRDTIGPPAAGLIVYLAVVFAWLYVAGFGLLLWNCGRGFEWGVLPLYAVVLFVTWRRLQDKLPELTRKGSDPSKPRILSKARATEEASWL
jgi:hypothetical protein